MTKTAFSIGLPTIDLPIAPRKAHPESQQRTGAFSSMTPSSALDPVLQRPLRLGERISFGRDGNARRFLVHPGWHAEEEGHCWTAASAALLAFNPLFSGRVFLHVDFFVLQERAWDEMHLAIALNNRIVFDGSSHAATNRIVARLGETVRPPQDINILTFYVDPASPRELLGKGDPRLLGIAVKTLWFES